MNKPLEDHETSFLRWVVHRLKETFGDMWKNIEKKEWIMEKTMIACFMYGTIMGIISTIFFSMCLLGGEFLDPGEILFLLTPYAVLVLGFWLYYRIEYR